MGPKDVDGRARRASSVLSVKASVTCKNGKAWLLQNKSNSPSPSEKSISRIRQGSNLRGETPTDILILKFKSVALTTRPRMLCTLHRKLNLYTENSKNIYWLLVAWHHRLDDADRARRSQARVRVLGSVHRSRCTSTLAEWSLPATPARTSPAPMAGRGTQARTIPTPNPPPAQTHATLAGAAAVEKGPSNTVPDFRCTPPRPLRRHPGPC